MPIIKKRFGFSFMKMSKQIIAKVTVGFIKIIKLTKKPREKYEYDRFD
jgi:hypothetical protein